MSKAAPAGVVSTDERLTKANLQERLTMAETKCTASEEALRKPLEQILQQLQVVQSGLITVACALRYQSCERDEDIACTLLHAVGDRLEVQMEHIAELIATVYPFEVHPDEVAAGVRH